MVKVSFKKSREIITRRLQSNIDDALEFVKDEAEKRTPEDKRNLVKNFEVERATKT